ncbi:MAG: phosphoribosylamine--glycine ligase [Candidatus Acidiferrales bacterium]
MKVLVIGSGGREHAIVWKLRQSASVEKIWCAPGNGGIASDAECVPLDLKDVKAAAELATKLEADLTIVGPELPLVCGIADEFAKRGLTLLGPSQNAAQLEGSKVFSKQFMQRHGIPTAPLHGIYDAAAKARAALRTVDWPLVIKADGLCAGKGVLVTNSADEAAAFIARLMESHEFGDAGKRILLEEGLSGEELSYIILTDGKDFISLAPTRDHKRIFDGDKGPNTGGMGAYSTDEMISPELEKQIRETIVRPTLDGLREDGIPYRGFLFFGLMLTSEGPMVLEFNCRLGDPETQAILLRAEFDLAKACDYAARGQLGSFQARWSLGASLCLVMASEGYPGNPTTGRRIEGLEEVEKVPGTAVFHAGTRKEGTFYYTNGGRVLGVGARRENLGAACKLAYDIASKVSFEGCQYRRDIGRPKAAMGRAAAETKNG